MLSGVGKHYIGPVSQFLKNGPPCESVWVRTVPRGSDRVRSTVWLVSVFKNARLVGRLASRPHLVADRANVVFTQTLCWVLTNSVNIFLHYDSELISNTHEQKSLIIHLQGFSCRWQQYLCVQLRQTATAWRKATARDDLWHIVDTVMLQ